MNIFIQSARIIDPHSPYHNQTKNLFIQDGIIKKISNETIEADVNITFENLCLSPGWFDMRVSFYDPGYEYKEDIQSGCRAAAYGGFTEVACLPVTNPVIQTKDLVHYIIARSRDNIVAVHPLASITDNMEGEALTEIIDLHKAGAVGFSDGHNPIWHPGLMIRALQYLQAIDGLLIQNADDRLLSGSGQMHEGTKSTYLGLSGMPDMAEWMTIERDLRLLDYAGGGKIHFSKISSAHSVDIIRQAKKQGYNISCDVAVHNLVFEDTIMENFQTYYKVKPPFRQKKDRKALWDGLKDGTIDVIVSDHNPQDTESKNIEFDLAQFGATGLESLYAAFNTYNEGILSQEQFIETIAHNPRKILNMPVPFIKEEQQANITLFTDKPEWIFDTKHIQSKSHNNPFTGHAFKGAPRGIIHKNQYHLNSPIQNA